MHTVVQEELLSTLRERVPVKAYVTLCRLKPDVPAGMILQGATGTIRWGALQTVQPAPCAACSQQRQPWLGILCASYVLSAWQLEQVSNASSAV